MGATQAYSYKVEFAAFDRDRSGSLDRAEMQQLLAMKGVHLSPKEFAEFYDEMDADGDGEVGTQRQVLAGAQRASWAGLGRSMTAALPAWQLRLISDGIGPFLGAPHRKPSVACIERRSR